MKKTLITAVLALFAQIAFTEPVAPATDSSSPNPPVPLDYYRKFIAIDITNGTGFYWLNSTTGHLWEFDRSLTEWEDHGTQKGMKPGPKGTYMLLSDNRDGAYVLNTRTGQGWWFDNSRWEIINDENALNREKATKL
jgi:hypothetical protein